MNFKLLLLSLFFTQILSAQTFTEVTFDSELNGVGYSSIAFSDVDDDNDQDVLITGQTSSFERITKLYLNDGIVISTDDVLFGSNFELLPYPNPAAANALKVDFNSTQNGFVAVKVYDLNGQILRQQKEFTTVGQQTISVNIDRLSAGKYFIQLDDGKGIDVGKFIIP